MNGADGARLEGPAHGPDAPALAGGWRYWAVVALLALLAAAGAAALALRLTGGAGPGPEWGYPAAALAFLLSTGQAAPILAFMTRLARGHWASPLRRAAELLGLSGLVALPLHLLLLARLPDWRGRPGIWQDWPGAPALWDGAAAALLALAGLALLHLAALPDLAEARDRGGPRLAGTLSLGWSGTARQWRALQAGLTALGALYLMLYVFLNLLVTTDLALSLVPGWHSASLPPYHAVSGLLGGVAATVLLASLLWRGQPPAARARRDALPAAARLMLALALLTFYFTWSEFLTYWYARTPADRLLLELLYAGPYLPGLVGGLGLCSLAPLLLLMWNRVRLGRVGPTVAAGLILVGLLLDRARLYVAAWSVAGPVREGLESVPPARLPDLLDGLVVLGAVAGALLLPALALRLVPGVAGWERRLDGLLRREWTYARATVPVVGKPS